MKFKILSIIALIFSVGLWFLNGKVLANENEDGWRILRDTAAGSALKFLWWPIGPTPSASSLTLKTDGNVGIGTDSPATRLHVNGGNFRFVNDTGQLDIQGTSGRNLIGSTGHLKISFDSNNNETDRVFQIGNNSLDFSSALFTVLENNNVGIGTSSPQSRLHIESSTPRILFLDTNATFGVNNPAWGVRSEGGGKFKIQTTADYSSYSDKMTITKDGDVGIGTTSPASKLDLGQLPGSTEGLRIQTAASSAFSPLVLTNSSNQNLFRVDQTGSVIFYPGQETFNYHLAILRSGDVPYLQGRRNDGTNAARAFAMQVDGGDVGIGTNNPRTLLHLQSGAPRLAFFDSDANLGVPNSTYPAWILRNENSSGTFRFQTTTDYSGYTDRITIDPNGNVGIGTTSPGYKLEVVGSAGKSTGTSWTNTSDIRLKDIHGNYDRGLKEILQLHPVLFSYKKDNALNLPSDKEISGFVAQEVQEVIPEAVSIRKDGYLEINVDPIHWAVVKAVQELYALFDTTRKDQQDQLTKQAQEIEMLKQEIQNLKQQISR